MRVIAVTQGGMPVDVVEVPVDMELDEVLLAVARHYSLRPIESRHIDSGPGGEQRIRLRGQDGEFAFVAMATVPLFGGVVGRLAR